MKKALAVLALLLLAGCASKPKEEFACPASGFMDDDAQAVFYANANAKHTDADIGVIAALKNFRGTCELAKDKHHAVLDIVFDVIVEKAKLAKPLTEQKLSYFSAVLSKEESVLQKRNFYITVPFSSEKGQGNNGAQTVELGITIPISSISAAGSDKVVVGLVLTPEQLEYNRTEHEVAKPAAFKP